jgi:hypothetical protein
VPYIDHHRLNARRLLGHKSDPLACVRHLLPQRRYLLGLVGDHVLLAARLGQDVLQNAAQLVERRLRRLLGCAACRLL